MAKKQSGDELIRKVEAKHRFYEEWYRGPMYEERR
jgi:hypothetical protein